MDEEEEEVPQCPLCLEELDATDRAVEACQCGYQICLWCLHHIREQLNSRCPACRTLYQEQNFKYTEVNPEEAAKEAKERATAKKERERREKMKEIEKERARAAAVSLQKAKSNLKHARIIQKNLVYVIGLSLTLAREEVIRRADMFGKFGRIVRILVNRSHPFNADAPGGPSISAYVQYARDSDASAAVRSMNNAIFDGREIRCAIATTKYCDVFVRNAANSPDPSTAYHCGNQNCMYYHSLTTDETLTREEVLASQLGPPPPSHLFLQVSSNVRGNLAPQSIHPRLAAHSAASGALSGLRSAGRQPPTNSMPSSSTTDLTVHPPSTTLPSSPLVATNSTAIPNHNVVNSIGSKSLESHSPRHVPVSEPHQKRSPSAIQTPPSSPRDSRWPLTRIQRSPTSQQPAAVKHPSRLAPTSMVSKPSSGSSMSPPPSLGWGSSQAAPKSRSSPSHGQTATAEDSMGSRPRLRLQSRRTRESSPPPGFEKATPAASSSLSKPPGFEAPVSVGPKEPPSNAINMRNRNADPGIAKAVTAVPPPPGFAPISASQSDSSRPPTNDVATAWAQEAVSDEVFSRNDRSLRRGFAGEIGRKPPHIPQDNADSRSELAQVLAKIGGDLGVSSEFKNVQSTPSESALHGGRLTQALYKNGRNSKKSQERSPAFGSHLRDQVVGNGYPAASIPLEARSSVSIPEELSPTAAFGNSSSMSGPPDAPISSPRRNTSRFVFAQQQALEQIRLLATSKGASFPTLSSQARLKTRSASPQMFQRAPQGEDRRNEQIFMKELLQSAKPPKPAVPSTSRQTRSRFDFADHGPSFSRTQNSTRAMRSNGDVPPRSAPPVINVHSNQNESITSLSQLSTQEKLASIFNSAQLSGESLPPMPSFDAHVDPLANPNLSAISPQRLASSRSQSPRIRLSRVPNIVSEEKSRTSFVSRPRQPPMPPPGFRDATPDISPESSTVDSPSTTSGVAKSSASGGELSISSKRTNRSHVVSIHESMSSGTERHEQDRKIIKTQKKKEKKEKKSTVFIPKNNREDQSSAANPKQTTQTAQSVQTIPPVNVTQPHHITQSGRARRPIQKMPPSQLPHPGNVAHTVHHFGSKPTSVSSSLKPTPTHAHPTVSSKTKSVGKLILEEAGSKQLVSESVSGSNRQQMRPSEDSGIILISSKVSEDSGKYMSVSELERQVEAARAREAQLQDKLLELQRRIRSYDNVRT